MAVTVEAVEAVTEELVDAFARLVPQLSQSGEPPTPTDLDDIVESQAPLILVARDEGTIVGTLTLVVFHIPTGYRAWIEDVIVDEAARGKGVGEALNREALRLAEAAGCRTVDLTSRPSRQAANRLYQRLGFKPRDTNVYRYEL
jgi:ribosomal protein S18 acetylase RimI-like enzyme